MKTACLLASAAMIVPLALFAQTAPAPATAPPPAAPLTEQQQAEARHNAMPDTPGTGRYPAMKEEVAALPAHTVYRPANLAALGRTKLPVIVWGNGACATDGANQRLHLSEIASHGYLVIANGGIESGPGVTPPPPPPPPPPPAPGAAPDFPPPRTSPEQMVAAIDWAVAENARAGSPLKGRIDTKAIAASGWSCGGVQALTVGSRDPRIRTLVIHNSGLFPDDMPRMRGMELTKASLAKIGVPVIYIQGGKSDIAYANGMDDYARLNHVPAAAVNLDVGHGGTFFTPNGGQAAQIAGRWFDWRLKGDRKAAAWFAGNACKLCGDPAVSYVKKGF